MTVMKRGIESVFIRAAAGLLGLWILLGALPASAQQFVPDLGLALEMIDGGRLNPVSVPPDAPELQIHPMEATPLKTIQTEFPDRPFLPVDPPPTGYSWWKMPIYAVVGFPRDLVDSMVGSLRFIPVVNVVAYAGYELVPVQAFMRDPRDWHRWDGAQNRNGHGWYDGNQYGHFPSLHQWQFTYPNVKKAQANAAENDQLRIELGRINRQAEVQNQEITNRKRNARTAALTAVEAGNGGEAVRWMLPYMKAYPLETEGSFALLATGLALAAPQGSEWMRPLLWQELSQALPATRAQTEALMARTLEQHPEADTVVEALIYLQLLRDDAATALKSTQTWLARDPENARLRRMTLETALSARNGAVANQMMAAIDQQMLEGWERQVLAARLQLIANELKPAIQTLQALAEANPENAYIHYYLGSAQLMLAQTGDQSMSDFQQAFSQLELATLQSPTAALRRRAGAALAFVRAVLAGPAPKQSAPAGVDIQSQMGF